MVLTITVLAFFAAKLRARQFLGVCLVETGDLKQGIAELEKVEAPGRATRPSSSPWLGRISVPGMKRVASFA